MSYDDWKTTDPLDEFLGPEPPPCELSYRRSSDHPRFPSGYCIICGAEAHEGCRHDNYQPWEDFQTGEED